MKERKFYLDVVRVLACIMVIAMHSPVSADKITATDTFLLAPLSYMAAPCIGLFFMVSGALLLPSRHACFDFLRLRLSRILAPTLFWTAFYITLHCTTIDSKDISQYLFKSILGIPFSAQGHGILWFMYTLMGIYLLVPILSRWWYAASKREIELYLCIWLISVCYPYIRLIVDIPSDETNMLYNFSGYVGYFVLGAYLSRYKTDGLMKIKVILPSLIVFSVLLPVITILTEKEINFYRLFWYLFISVVAQCIFYFVLIQRYAGKIKQIKVVNLIENISKMSFGIYLIHIFVLRICLWNIDSLTAMSYILQIPIFTILTFTISYMLSRLISKVPFSKYIIGC